LADTTTAGTSWKTIAEAPVRAVVFAEIIGLRRDRGLQTDAAAWKWLGSVRPETQVAACARVGLSPHAPYSTSGWLYYKAAASGLPLSTHLAEMPEELQLLEFRDGPLRRFLEDLDAMGLTWNRTTSGSYVPRPHRVTIASPSPSARGPTRASGTELIRTGRSSSAARSSASVRTAWPPARA
jgi:cytosine/adenosine deaminase-related metal-dependent hydrolase